MGQKQQNLKYWTRCSYYDINSQLASLLQCDSMVQNISRQLLNRLPIIWGEWFNLCWYTWIKPERFSTEKNFITATMIILHNISNGPFNFSRKLWDHFSFLFFIFAFFKSALSQFLLSANMTWFVIFCTFCTWCTYIGWLSRHLKELLIPLICHLLLLSPKEVATKLKSRQKLSNNYWIMLFVWRQWQWSHFNQCLCMCECFIW